LAYPPFPAIAKPVYPYDETPEDPGIQSQQEDGSMISRARFTKSRLSFSLRWKSLSKSDKSALMTFYRDTVKGCSEIFTWTCDNPSSEFYNQTFNVRFASPPKFSNSVVALWEVEITLEEA
jgi:hypothetical protein